jgi:acyl-CoA hydrolase
VRTTIRFSNCERCVDTIIERVGKRIVLGAPLGIGKPNALLNALYARAKADPSIHLELITALSLNPPIGASDLEERLLAPIRARVWGDYPRLAFLDDRAAGRLPDNVRILEFYMRSGTELSTPTAQADYISANYTHVARDMLGRGVNLLMQAVAVREDAGTKPRYSLSSNPDVTLDLLPMLEAAGAQVLLVAQVNRGLPWLGNDAEISSDFADLLLDDPALDHAPFSVPHEPVDTTAWAIGARASALVRDGGTLQVGIGALGDAVCHALRLRQRDPKSYRELLDDLGRDRLAGEVGGDGAFETGLYVASELISDALFSLFEDGIVRRTVFETESDLGVDGNQRALVRSRPRGTVLQGAFLLGDAAFYRKLHALTDDQRAVIDMTSVGEVNRIYVNYGLERLQRRHARFLNITMLVTALGAAVSDQLADGRVVSGVGGQSDFVNMAHQLPDGRSVLMFRATRERDGVVTSNIVWEYGQTTIPRHMRDVFVTEYGVAELRGKTDRECVEAMLALTDSRFQDDVVAAAKRAHKLPLSYAVPDHLRRNTPERVAAALRSHQASGELPALPYGSDITAAEMELIGKLKRLKTQLADLQGWAGLARALALEVRDGLNDDPRVQHALEHLGIAQPRTARELAYNALVRAAYRS